MTLNALGDPNAVFIFRAASTLITGIASTVVLSNGAQACNVFWQIGSSATLGASSTMVGHVIALASISTGLNSTINGQLIGTTGAVTLGGSTIVNDSCAAPVATPTPTPTPTDVATPTPTPTDVATPTPTPTVVATPTPTPTVVATPTPEVQLPTVSIVYVDCKHGGVVTCTENSTERAMWVKWISTLEKSFIVEWSPTTNQGSSFSSTSTGDVDKYLGLGTRGTTYTIKVTVFTNDNYTGSSASATVTYTVPTLPPMPTPTPVATTTPTPTPTPVATPTPEPSTETGGKLPNTSLPWGNLLLGGSLMILVGIIGLTTRTAIKK
jgi:type VI secretion system secreted protein VgrG